MRTAIRSIAAATIAALVALSTACTTSVVRETHPLYSAKDDRAVTIYFLRPLDQRTRGVVDSDIKVTLNDELAIELSVGEYTAVRIKPGKTEIMLKNMTYIAANPTPEEVWRSVRTEFEPGRTYYVVARMKMEEYRGVYFVPELVDETVVKTLLKGIKPAGTLAKSQPLK